MKTENGIAKYWEDWAKIGEFDAPQWVCEIFLDHEEKAHLIKRWTTIDGKMLPDEFGTPRQFFESHEIPYDESRVGEMFCDRKMSKKKALKIWISETTPTDLRKFISQK